MTRANVLKRLLPLIAVGGLVTAFFTSGFNHYLTLQTLHDHRLALHDFVTGHPFTAAAAFVAVYVLVVGASLPGGAVMTISGGFLFGLWVGALLSVIGATIGAIIVFVLARLVIGDALRTRAGPFLARMEAGFNRNALSYLLFLRLVPFFPFWAVNLGPAFLGVRLRTFAVATVVGMIPGTLAYASVGDGLGLLTDAGPEVSLSGSVDPMTIAIRVGLASLALLPVAIRRLIDRRRA